MTFTESAKAMLSADPLERLKAEYVQITIRRKRFDLWIFKESPYTAWSALPKEIEQLRYIMLAYEYALYERVVHECGMNTIEAMNLPEEDKERPRKKRKYTRRKKEGEPG